MNLINTCYGHTDPIFFSVSKIHYFLFLSTFFPKFVFFFYVVLCRSQMALVANMAVATVNFLSTFIAIYSVDKAGRRPLLILGGFGMVCIHISMSIHGCTCLPNLCFTIILERCMGDKPTPSYKKILEKTSKPEGKPI